jgi:hypothetical protein
MVGRLPEGGLLVEGLRPQPRSCGLRPLSPRSQTSGRTSLCIKAARGRMTLVQASGLVPAEEEKSITKTDVPKSVSSV